METMGTTFTRIDWERLPEGFPAQLIQGQLVREAAPTYGHQRIAARIRHALATLVGPDRVPDTPADVAVDDENVFQPDVVVLAKPADDASPYVGVPILVVEVLSPSTRNRDRNVKTGRLLEIGVEEVWLVDPERRTIEVRRSDGAPDGATVSHAGERARSDSLPGFFLEPDSLFSPPRTNA